MDYDDVLPLCSGVGGHQYAVGQVFHHAFRPLYGFCNQGNKTIFPRFQENTILEGKEKQLLIFGIVAQLKPLEGIL